MSTTTSSDEPSEFVSHPYLKSNSVEAREYQTTLTETTLTESSIVALPTGTGKTIVALLASLQRLREHGGTVLFLAPTKPLVEQQAAFYREVMDIPDHEIKVFTGDVRPDDRASQWEGATSVVVATPQVIQNDLVAGRINLESVSHLTFDECHRATGEYAYGYIAEKYWKDAADPLVLGLSASPGSKRESILNVATNLGVTNIEALAEDHPLLAPYTFETTIEPTFVPLDEEILEMRDTLEDLYAEMLGELKTEGVLSSRDKKRVGFRQLNAAMGAAKKQNAYRMMSLCSEAMKLDKALEAIETQGPAYLASKLESHVEAAAASDASKAVQRLVEREEFKRVHTLATEYDKTHPKRTALIASLVDPISDGGQAIVFTQSRATAARLVSYLDGRGPISAHRFVGQNNDDGMGMSQTDQQETLERFRAGAFNILVSTSVAEEGLDIPQVDLVVFNEPVPSAVRSIQRKGRTGRASDGLVKVLIAKDTRDEGYWYKAKRDEEEMDEELAELSEMTAELNEELGSNQETLGTYESLSTEPATNTESESPSGGMHPDEVEDTTETVETPSVDSAADEPAYIEADTREGSSSVVRGLDLTEGVDVGMSQLAVGDFVLSNRVAVERKSAQDFADTLVEGRRSMFEQLGNLASNYDRPVLVLEGTQEELMDARNIHPNAIRGALQSLTVDFGVSVLWSRGEEETTHHLANIAQREQNENDNTVSVHESTSSDSRADQQEYIVSSIADVGPVTAASLLEALGSVHEVFTADVETLQTVSGVGEVTATRIVDIVRSEYGQHE
jgi:Fanconi anemia group M protein